MEVRTYIVASESILCQFEFLCLSFPVTCENGYVRLVNDTPNSFLIKDAVSRGRVEICIDQMFQTICEDGWSDVDASVLCAELGFSTYG